MNSINPPSSDAENPEEKKNESDDQNAGVGTDDRTGDSVEQTTENMENAGDDDGPSIPPEALQVMAGAYNNEDAEELARVKRMKDLLYAAGGILLLLAAVAIALPYLLPSGPEKKSSDPNAIKLVPPASQTQGESGD
ncbi:MAG: hypothetical protein AAFP90_18505 [Planctomycetota bacterium]